MKKNHEEIIKEYLLKRTEGILKQPVGKLEFPFFDPGEGYGGELWNWDSALTGQALYTAFDIFPEKELARYGLTRGCVTEHGKGCVLNFLKAQEADGYIPVLACEGGLFEGYFEKNLYDETAGLFFFQDDIMIGIDNNPTVFGRPPRSSADIFLNSILYMEYCAMAGILKMAGDGRGAGVTRKAEKLKEAVNRGMWDGHDGLYYSQDLIRYRNGKTVGNVRFHAGLAPSWDSMPLKIRFLGCFLPLWAGLCSGEQARRICAHLEDDDDIMAAYGIRTCAKNEKMYNLEKSANPSNWLGAVWTVGNVLVWLGLRRYGKEKLAERLRDATITLLGNSIEKYGGLFESCHPDSGEPMLHPGFLSFNLLVFEMFRK